jgi:hypothetical protein
VSLCKSGLQNITIVENNLSPEERMKEMRKNVLFFDWQSFCLNGALGCILLE